MAKYKSREFLFKESKQLNDKTWFDWIYTLTVPSSSIETKLYHISFDSNLPRVITPQYPKNVDGSTTPHPIYNERLPPRVSASPSVIGCWRGIYANFSEMFYKSVDVEKIITIYVYEVIPDVEVKILTPETATAEWLLYDSHFTNEYSIFGRCTMKSLGKIEISNNPLAEDSTWSRFKPYNLDKYESLYGTPPLIVSKSTIPPTVTLEHNLTELNMDNYVKSNIHELTKQDLEEISLEAFNNPLQGITESIKNRLHNIVKSISSISSKGRIGNNPELKDMLTDFSSRHVTNTKTNDNSVSYIDVKEMVIVVPVGFSGNILEYTNVIVTQCSLLTDLSKQVIEPTHNLILKYIGKPESMLNISTSDLSKVNLHNREIEIFKKDMNKFFNTKKKHQTQPIKILISNFRQFIELGDILKRNIVPFIVNDSDRHKIFKSYTQLQSSLDLLLVRIEQKPEQYQLNKLNAERLSNLIRDVALEIELYSATVSYCEQLMSIYINLDKQIKNSVS